MNNLLIAPNKKLLLNNKKTNFDPLLFKTNKNGTVTRIVEATKQLP